MPPIRFLPRLLVFALLLCACGGSDAQSGPETVPENPPAQSNASSNDDTDAGTPTHRMRVIDIAAGEQHTVAILDDGSVWTWGNSSSGAIGREVTIDDYWLPRRIPGVTGRMAAAGTSTSYVYDGESLWTTGYNSQGHLGYGPTGEEERFSSRPFPDLKDMEAFGDHIVVLMRDSTVLVWGSGSAGALNHSGVGSRTQAEPLQVPGMDRIAAISAGGGFSLALRDDGTVWAWGLNNNGELGNTSVASYATTTRTTTNADGSVSVSSSGAASGTYSDRPVRVEIEDIIAIAAGGRHAIAIHEDGTVWGWGNNQRGSLGFESEGDYVLTPTRIPGLEDVVAVGAGHDYSLALKADGSLWVWGTTVQRIDREAPFWRALRVPGLTPIARIEAGGRHAFAIGENGALWGWGLTDMGQVGSEDSEGSTDWPPLRVRFAQ